MLVDGKGDYDRAQFTQANGPLAGSRILQWESNDRYDWAVMHHEGFQDRPVPVSWVRHFVLLKGLGALLVDQLESGGEHDYTWLFHLLPCSPVLDNERQIGLYRFRGEESPALCPPPPAFGRAKS